MDSSTPPRSSRIRAGAAVISPGRAYALLGGVVLVWAANWPIMKYGLRFITPLWFAVLRFALGAICLFGVLVATRRFAWPKRADLPVVASVGALQMALFVMLVNAALVHVPAGRSAILAYTTPLWVLPGAVVFLKEKVQRAAIFGLVLGFVGIVVLFNPAALDWSKEGVVTGNLMLLGAAICWAFAIVHVRGHRWEASPLAVAPYQMLLAIAVMLPFAVALEGAPAITWSKELVFVLFYNGPFATAFCFWAAVSVTRALPAITTSLSFLAVPVLGVAMSSLALGESISVDLMIGFALILGGVSEVTLAERRAQKPRA